MDTKKCKDCEQVKLISDFGKLKRNKDGISHRCKKCWVIYVTRINSKKRKRFDTTDLPGEIWKDIPGYDGYFQASNMGRIKGLERYIKDNRDRAPLLIRSKIKAQARHNGYMIVGLNKGLSDKKYGVHRLVALAFLDKPEGKNDVNHIDAVRHNNRIENLEWCTRKENIQHSIRIGTFHFNRTAPSGDKNPLSTAVYQFDLNRAFIAQHGSQGEASRETGIRITGINACLKGRSSHAGGFIWEYKNQENKTFTQ